MCCNLLGIKVHVRIRIICQDLTSKSSSICRKTYQRQNNSVLRTLHPFERFRMLNAINNNRSGLKMLSTCFHVDRDIVVWMTIHSQVQLQATYKNNPMRVFKRKLFSIFFIFLTAKLRRTSETILAYFKVVHSNIQQITWTTQWPVISVGATGARPTFWIAVSVPNSGMNHL